MPDPNERELGTLAAVKILGPGYSLEQWPLIVHTLLGMIFPMPVNSPADQGRQGQFGECGLEATLSRLSLPGVEADLSMWTRTIWYCSDTFSVLA